MGLTQYLVGRALLFEAINKSAKLAMSAWGMSRKISTEVRVVSALQEGLGTWYQETHQMLSEGKKHIVK